MRQRPGTVGYALMVAGRIPATFPVQPIKSGEYAKDRATCGTCGLSWFEYFHSHASPPKGRKMHLCDGCDKMRSDVRSMGRDSNGGPDAPDLCFVCRKEGERGRLYDTLSQRYKFPEYDTPHRGASCYDTRSYNALDPR
jgi:hypothetical protein